MKLLVITLPLTLAASLAWGGTILNTTNNLNALIAPAARSETIAQLAGMKVVLANRWLFGLRRYRRTEVGARGVLGACAAQVCRRGESESTGCGGDRHGHAHGRTVSDRTRRTPARVECGRTPDAAARIRRRVVARYSR